MLSEIRPAFSLEQLVSLCNSLSPQGETMKSQSLPCRYTPPPYALLYAQITTDSHSRLVRCLQCIVLKNCASNNPKKHIRKDKQFLLVSGLPKPLFRGLLHKMHSCVHKQSKQTQDQKHRCATKEQNAGVSRRVL